MHTSQIFIFSSQNNTKGQDSSASIATGYGPDVPGIESWWRGLFAPIETGPGAHPASYTMGTGSFLGLKRPAYGTD